MKMSNATYDVLKKLSLLTVPLVTFILAVSDIVGWAHGSDVCAIISAFGVFMGAALEISTRQYNADKEIVDEENDAEDTKGVG